MTKIELMPYFEEQMSDRFNNVLAYGIIGEIPEYKEHSGTLDELAMLLKDCTFVNKTVTTTPLPRFKRN